MYSISPACQLPSGVIALEPKHFIWFFLEGRSASKYFHLTLFFLFRKVFILEKLSCQMWNSWSVILFSNLHFGDVAALLFCLRGQLCIIVMLSVCKSYLCVAAFRSVVCLVYLCYLGFVRLLGCFSKSCKIFSHHSIYLSTLSFSAPFRMSIARILVCLCCSTDH